MCVPIWGLRSVHSQFEPFDERFGLVAGGREFVAYPGLLGEFARVRRKAFEVVEGFFDQIL